MNVHYVMRSLLVGSGIVLIASSCVTRNKYDRLVQDQQRTEMALRECTEARTLAETDLNEATARLNEQAESLNKLRNDTSEVGMAYRRTRSMYNELNDTYEKLLRNHDRLLSNTTAQASQLSQDLRDREAALLEAEKKMQASRRQVDSLSAGLQSREERVKELERLMAEKDAKVNALQQQVQRALLGFKEEDLSVEIRNGRVYVSLSEKLLFKSGSFNVDPAGRDALKRIAPVLREQSDITIKVEGHTDDVPLSSSARMADNWDLSVLRATSIVRALNQEGVPGVRLEAAGRGEYQPVVAEKTPTARQKNRRTEIILEPNLSDLYRLIDND